MDAQKKLIIASIIGFLIIAGCKKNYTDPGSQLRGVMNSTKKTIFSTATMAPADSTGVRGYNLIIWIKK